MHQLKPIYDRQNSCRILPASSGFQFLPASPNGNLAFQLNFPPCPKEQGFHLEVVMKTQRQTFDIQLCLLHLILVMHFLVALLLSLLI